MHTAKDTRRGLLRFCIAAGVCFAIFVSGWIAWSLRWTGFTENEKWVLTACREYADSQRAYARVDWNADGVQEYARSPAVLHTQKDKTGVQAKLVSASFVAACHPRTKHFFGYHFKEMTSIGGRPVDWRANFALCATPTDYAYCNQKLGVRLHTFIVKTDGVIWAKDIGKGEFVENFPANPISDGWTRVE